MATDFAKRPPANHRIKRILKSYEQSAERSLSGPSDDRTPEGTRHGALLSGRGKDQVPSKRSGPALEPPTPPPPGRSTGATAPSGGKCDIIETVLEGARIACFEVGGEQRLCMPQILSTVLRDFDPAQVFEVCEELHIFFSRCDPDQLGSLIRAKILPQKVTTCGLITYTNAERMCSTLLRNQSAYKYRLPVAMEGLKVYHECFGGCRGVFMPEAFNCPTARCVQCAECGEMFGPAQFVSHSHSELENGTIHWGFNPVNWKSYLMLSLEQTGYPRVQELLDGLKNKFQDDEDKKTDKIVIKQEVEDRMPVKRIRYDRPNISVAKESLSPKWVPADVGGAWKFCVGLCKQLDNIKLRSDTKLPPFLQTETPFLADSDRVISYTESQWADRSFTPNVSLDPVSYRNLVDVSDDDCDEKEPVMIDKKDVTVTTSYKWSPSFLSSGISTVVPTSNSGNVSDDEDNESVLSDKLPAITEDDDQTCDRISSVWNARLGLLIRALEGEVLRSVAEDPLKEFMKLQEQHSDIVSSLADNSSALSQRRLYLWTLMEDKLHAMEEMRKNQDESLACLKQENAMKMQETMHERCQLKEQIEKLSNGSVDSDLATQVTRYKEEAEVLRKQLLNAEEMNASLRCEIANLHRAIEKLIPEHGHYLPLVVQPEISTPTTVTLISRRPGRLPAPPMPCAPC